MSKKVLANVKMDATCTSYIAAVGGVLRGVGWWNEETYKLLGMTGIGFHFIVHRQACPSSVTVYDWVGEHLAALDRIGIYSEVFQYDCDYYSKLNTFLQVQATALRRIKASLDRGIGVAVWAPSPILEFGIIKGYDDGDQIFWVEDCTGEELDPLVYSNLGKSEVPMLFYQIFYERLEVAREPIYRNSLEFAIREWHKDFHISPQYASGSRAYDNLIATLEKGDFDQFGLPYNLAVYADAKQNIAKYLDFIKTDSQNLTGLERVAKQYGEIAGIYAQLTALAPFNGCNGQGGGVDRRKVPEILNLVREAKKIEMEAVQELERVLEG